MVSGAAQGSVHLFRLCGPLFVHHVFRAGEGDHQNPVPLAAEASQWLTVLPGGKRGELGSVGVDRAGEGEGRTQVDLGEGNLDVAVRRSAAHLEGGGVDGDEPECR